MNYRNASRIGVFDQSVDDRRNILFRNQAIGQNLVKEAGVAGFGLVERLTSNEMVDRESGVIFGVEGRSAIVERGMFLEGVNSCG